MINYLTGNILEAEADALVNTVNCEGFMGKGIAYQFKVEFPENLKAYQGACRHGDIGIGKIFVFDEKGKTIINFPTKDKWREKSKYEYIESGLADLKEWIFQNQIKSVAIPPLGCGNGGLEWHVVKELIIDALEEFENTDIYVYEPSKYYASTPRKEPKLSFSHYVLMQIKEKLGDKCNKMRLQKAAFLVNLFVNEDFFRFKPHKFGPYSYSIEILSNDIRDYQNFHRISTNEAMALLTTKLTSRQFEEKRDRFQPCIDLAVEFIQQMNSIDELEIVSTIMYILDANGPSNYEQIWSELERWDQKNSDGRKTDLVESIENVKFYLKKLDSMHVVNQDMFDNYELVRKPIVA